MASVAKSFARSALCSRPSTIRSTATRSTRLHVPRQTVQQQFRRSFAEEATPKVESTPSPPPPKSSNTGLFIGLGLVAAAGAGFYIYSSSSSTSTKTEPFIPKFEDYQAVYDAIAKQLAEQDDYDDGSYGPVLLRLAWHASGTYDKETGTGGSNGATMRFAPESDHGANAGLKAARNFLEPVKEQFPWITYSDLWTLGGVTAIQEMQGPAVAWRPGRQDRDVAFCTPDGRLPDASKEQKHLRDIFYRMGFDDREIVALAGAHALGRCHVDRSGFDGPWTFSPTVLTNDYFKLLLEEKWGWRKWDGPKQYSDKATGTLMMLPADMALIKDKSFKKTVEEYAKDNDKFFTDFSAVIVKLFELGVPFTTSDRFTFKPQTGL